MGAGEGIGPALSSDGTSKTSVAACGLKALLRGVAINFWRPPTACFRGRSGEGASSFQVRVGAGRVPFPYVAIRLRRFAAVKAGEIVVAMVGIVKSYALRKPPALRRASSAVLDKVLPQWKVQARVEYHIDKTMGRLAHKRRVVLIWMFWARAPQNPKKPESGRAEWQAVAESEGASRGPWMPSRTSTANG
jgi:hypothetical protein